MKRIAIAILAVLVSVGCTKTKKYPIPLFDAFGGEVTSSTSSASVGTSNSTATSVTDVSSDSSSGTYNVGDTVTLVVTFKESVDVTGTPTLTLNNGATATYASGSGGTTLTFTYTIQAGDDVSSLNYAATDSLNSNDGTNGTVVVSGTTTAADTTLPDPGSNTTTISTASIQVDTGAPTVSSVQALTSDGTYKVGDTILISVKMSELVNTTGTPLLNMATGGSASYISGSGSDTLIFQYTIPAGANTSDLNYVDTSSLVLNGGTIKDASDNDAIRTLPDPTTGSSLATNSAIQIAPAVSSVASSTGNGPFNAGDTISIEITYDQNITLDTAGGTPTLTLNLPGNPTATCSTVTGGNTLVCTYTVQAGDNTSDLDYVNASSLVLNGATIKGSSGVDAVNTLPDPSSGSSLAGGNQIVVDTTSPSLTSITTTTSAATYGLGASIPIRLTFDEAISIVGGQTPTITLNTGDTVNCALDPADTTNKTLLCTYTVGTGDSTSGGSLSVTAVTLNGRVTDTAGNTATDGLNSQQIKTGIIIDTNAPVLNLSVVGGATSGNEGSTVTLRATLTNLTGTSTIAYSGTLTGTGGSSDAASASDYSFASTAISFPAGTNNGATQDIVVTLASDSIDEKDEKVTFSAGSLSSGLTLGTTISDFTINDQNATPSLNVTSLGTIAEGSSKTLSFSLSGVSSSDTTFTVSSATGTAGSSDYSGVSTSNTTITIPAGSTTPSGGTTSFTVAATDDSVYEGGSGGTAEQFTITVGNMSNATNAPSGAGSQTVSITDTDTAPAISIVASGLSSGSSGSINEGGTITYTVSYPSGVTNGSAVAVPVAITGSSTFKASDYTLNGVTGGNVTIPAGQNSVTFTVDVATDDIDEPDETITATLSAPSGYSLGTGSSTGTITDTTTDVTLGFSSSTGSINEGASGNLTLALSGKSEKTYTYSASSSNGTATAGSDYTAISVTDATLVGTGAAGQTTTLAINATDDSAYEGGSGGTAENYTVSLTGDVAGTTSSTVSIVDQDSLGTISLSVVSGLTADATDETGGAITYRATIAGATTSPNAITVDVGLTGTAGSADYTTSGISSGKITIPAGQSSVDFTIDPVTDDIDESNETVIVTLSNPSESSIGTASHTATINDTNTDVTLAFSSGSGSVTEGATSTVGIVLSGKTTKSFTYAVASSDGTAAAGSDYTAISLTGQTISGGDGSAVVSDTITVNASTDSVYGESSETYTLTLSGSGVSGQTTSTVTITDATSAPSFSLDGGSAVTKAEGSGTYTMTLSSGSTTLPANKTYTVEYTGTATGSGTDYTGTTSVTINAGATSGTFDVAIVDDAVLESSETIIVTVKDGSTTVATQTITIEDNEMGISAANTMDYDNDGQVDGYEIVFTEAVTDSSFDANVAKWAVASHASISRKTDYPGDTSNDNTLYINFSEIGVNTAEKPDLTTSSGGGITAVSGKTLADIDTATVAEADRAKPVVVSAVGTAGDNQLTVTYSEPVYTTSGATGAIVSTDVTYGDNNAAGGTSVTGMGSDTDGSDNVVIYTTNVNFVNADSADTVAGNSNIFDAADNTGNTTPVNLSINITIDGIEIVLRDHTTVETDPNDVDFVGALLKMHNDDTKGFAAKLDSDSTLVNGCSDVTCLMDNVLNTISGEMGAYLKTAGNGGYSLITRNTVGDALIPTEIASVEVQLNAGADDVNDVRNHYVDKIGTKTGAGTVSNLPTSSGSLTSDTFRIEVQASKQAGTGNPGIVLIGITTKDNYSVVEVDLSSLVNGTNVAETGTYKLPGDKNFFSVAAPKLDFLVSVNNSATMIEEQAATRSSLAAFYARLRNLSADFRVSVVTSDCDQLWAKDTDNFDFTSGQHQTCQPSGLGSGEGITDWGAGTKYFSNSAQDQTDFNEIFNPSNTLTRGIFVRGYSVEANLMYAEKAIAKSGEDGATANGTFTQIRTDNSRSDVPITVIIISDDPDQYDEVLDSVDGFSSFTPTLPNSVFNKDTNRFITQNITVHVVSPLDAAGGVANCTGTNGSTSEVGKSPYNGGVDPDLVYGQITSTTNGMQSSICSDAPDAFMELIANQSVAEAIDATYTLAHMPITNTLTVKVNGAAIDMGIATAGSGTTKYIFNSVTKKIAFTGDLPTVGSAITVEYSYFSTSSSMNMPGDDNTLLAFISAQAKGTGAIAVIGFIAFAMLLLLYFKRRAQLS
ncbi:MAG: Calx-beta domain-containing protein [Spirochaetota bacterium]